MLSEYKKDFASTLFGWRGVTSLGFLMFVVAFGASFVFQGCPGQPIDEKSQQDGSNVWTDESPIQIGKDASTDRTAPDETLPSSPITFTSISVTPVPKALHQVKMAGESMIAAGEGIFFREKEDQPWKDVSPSRALGDLYSLAVHPQKQLILAVGGKSTAPKNGVIFLSENGGKTWAVKKIIQSQSDDLRLRSVVWLNPATAIAVGMSGQMYRSRDKGQTWNVFEAKLPPAVGAADWFRIQHVGSYTFLAGSKGALLRSTDSGATWTQMYSAPPTSSFHAVYFLDTTYGVAVGKPNLSVLTGTSGRSWEKVTLPSTFEDEQFVSASGYGDTNLLVHTKRSFWLSKNRGRFWRDFSVTATELPAQDSLTHVEFSDPKTIWFSTTRGTLLKGVFR